MREKNCCDSKEVSEADVTNVIARYGKVCKVTDLLVTIAGDGDRKLCVQMVAEMFCIIDCLDRLVLWNRRRGSLVKNPMGLAYV